jgi:hypothetical protein
MPNFPGKLSDRHPPVFDPESLEAGMILAGHCVEAGVHRFADVSTRLAKDLGVPVAGLRRNLSGYNAARGALEEQELDVSDMDDRTTVEREFANLAADQPIGIVPMPLSQQAVETMALRWAKQYRPAPLPELNAQSPTAAREWAAERARAILEAFEDQAPEIEGQAISDAEIRTRLRSLWEILLADHFPVTPVEPSEAMTPEAWRRLEARHQAFLKKEMAEWPQPLEEAEATWEQLKDAEMRYILEEIEMEEMDR